MSILKIKDKIRSIRESLNLSQKEFGRLLGIRDTAVSKYELGSVKPSFDILSKIGNTFNVNLNWLLTDKENMFLDDDSDQKAAVYCYIPEFGDPVSAGAGAIMNSEGIEIYHCFPKSFIINELFASIDDLFMLKVMGDSMEPLINDNDLVMVDRSSKIVREGKVYICSYYNELLLKKIQIIGNGKYRLISENNILYPPIESPKEDITIIGRVIWFARKI